MDNLTTNLPHSKHCAKCGETKPREAFSRNNGAKDKLFSWCKACQKKLDAARNAHPSDEKRAQRKAYYDEHREQEIARAKRWNDAHKDEHRSRSRLWNKENASRHAHNQRIYYWNNVEYIRATDRARNQCGPRRLSRKMAWHRRRTRIAGNGGYFNAKDVAHMRYIQQGHCAYCGRLGQHLQIEHITPISRHGPSDPYNLCLACRRCNLNKGSKLLSEWTTRWYLK